MPLQSWRAPSMGWQARCEAGGGTGLRPWESERKEHLVQQVLPGMGAPGCEISQLF